MTLDANGNIAVQSEPDSLAQDAASAIMLFLGEYYWDTTEGVPWLQQILSPPPPAGTPPLPLLKQLLVDAALTVPGVASAQVFISSFANRAVTGQVQVVSQSGGLSAANFTTTNPQGT
ncbi:MAG: hypothetical protein ACRELF_15735 [Gemmataceae bacterium]